MAGRSHLVINPHFIMDQKLRAGRPEGAWINVNFDYELKFWSRRLNISIDELKAAINVAGTSVTEIEKYLRK